MSAERSLTRAWAIPLGLAVLSIAGLVLALLYEGVVDVIAVAFVIVPLVVIARQLARRAPPASPPAPSK